MFLITLSFYDYDNVSSINELNVCKLTLLCIECFGEFIIELPSASRL